MRRVLVVGLLVGLAPFAGACASASARTKPADMPALNVPPPPPRVIEPAPPGEPAPDPVGDLPAPPSSPVRTPRREPPPKPAAEPKTEPKTEPTPVEPAPVPPPPQQPVPQLSTPQTADPGEAARAVQATIDRARQMLGSINFRTLSNERKKAYNDAKMFLDQAQHAIKQGNYTFAQGVAVKAETLARELSGG